jgi:hypothetical protein
MHQGIGLPDSKNKPSSQQGAKQIQRKIGLGVCLFTYERDKRIVLSDITVKNCVFRRLASGFWTLLR